MVVPRSLPGFGVCRAPPVRRGWTESPEPSGKAGCLEAPVNSFAREDLRGRPARKQFVNKRISLPLNLTRFLKLE